LELREPAASERAQAGTFLLEEFRYEGVVRMTDQEILNGLASRYNKLVQEAGCIQQLYAELWREGQSREG